LKKIIFFVLWIFSTVALANPILPGAEQTKAYLPLLKNKRVGLFANHTSRVGKQALVDYLRAHHIQVVKIFVPEHGFRGSEEGGNHIHDSVDVKTGIPIVSLYGKKLKPTPEDLKNIDVLVFDIQDVGVRFSKSNGS
jgi:uncharacterized protein YbbC (DUF1343 family)